MQAVRSGRAVPPRLLEPPPEVQQGLGIYMRGFFELASDRQQGGKIPWSTIQDWCEANGQLGDDAKDAHFLLGRMDLAYMSWAKDKGKKMSADKRALEESRNGIAGRVR